MQPFFIVDTTINEGADDWRTVRLLFCTVTGRPVAGWKTKGPDVGDGIHAWTPLNIEDLSWYVGSIAPIDRPSKARAKAMREQCPTFSDMSGGNDHDS